LAAVSSPHWPQISIHSPMTTKNSSQELTKILSPSTTNSKELDDMASSGN